MEFLRTPGRIYALDRAGRLIAEITFPAEDGVANLNHTFVDDSLRGQGVAGRLVAAAAEEIRAAGLKVRPSCSYAAAWFSRHPEQADLLI